MSTGGAEPAKAKAKKWVPYLIRGVLGTIIALTIIQYFLIPQKLSNWPIYLGIYFIANGALSFKVEEIRLNFAGPTKSRGPILAALASLIGGVLVIVSYVFSRVTPDNLGLYPYIFGAIVIVIGLLQVNHAVRMTPYPILKRAHLVFGFLEILLGIVMFGFQVDWQADAVALVWVVLVAAYMFYVTHSVRSM